MTDPTNPTDPQGPGDGPDDAPLSPPDGDALLRALEAELEAEEELDEALEAGLEEGLRLAALPRATRELPEMAPTPVETADGELPADEAAAYAPGALTPAPAVIPLAPAALRDLPAALRVWGSTDFQEAQRVLSVTVDDLHADLEAAASQEKKLLEHAKDAVSNRLRELIAQLQELRSESDEKDSDEPPLEELRTHANAVLSAVADKLQLPLAHYFDDDPIIRVLEASLSGLEHLPRRVPLQLPITYERDLGSAGQLAARLRLISGQGSELIPLRRVVSLAIARSDIYVLEGFFPKRQRARRNLNDAIAEILAQTTEALRKALDETAVRDEEGPSRAREIVVAATAAVEALDDLFEPLYQVTTKLVEAATGIREALASLPVMSAMTATRKGDWSVRWQSLVHGLGNLLRRLRSRVTDGRAQRLRYQVMHHPSVQAALPDLTRRVTATIGEVKEALEQDRTAHQEVLAPLEAALQSAHERISEVYEGLGDTARGRPRALKRATTRQLKQMYRVLHRGVLPKLQRNYRDDPLMSALGEAGDEVFHLHERLEDMRLVFPRPETPAMRLAVFLRLVRPEQTLAIPFRSIVRRWLLRRRAWELRDLTVDLGDVRERFLSSIDDIWNITRYNLEGAIAEIEEGLEDRALAADDKHVIEVCDAGQQAAVTGLERALTRTRSLVTELESFHTEISDNFAEKVDFAEGVRNDVGGAAYLRGRMANGIASAAMMLRSAQHRVAQASERGTDLAKRYGATAKEALETRSVALRQIFGLDVPLAAPHVAPLTEAVAEQLVRAWDHIPPVYRRLFTLEPVELEEFLLGRDDALAAIEAAAKRWKAGQRASVLIHGSRGSGKRSLINIGFERFLPEAPVSRLMLERRLKRPIDLVEALAHGLQLELPPMAEDSDETTAVAKLEQALLEAERRVILLERASYVYIRDVGGFEALKTLLLLVLRTSQRHLWVVVMESHAQALLKRLWRVDDAFTHVIATNDVPAATLRAAIEKRHEPSGFALHFDVDDATRASLRRDLRAMRHQPAGEQLVFADYFFEQLHAVSGGNLFVALFYWLRSILPDDGQASAELTSTTGPLRHDEQVLRISQVRPLEFASIGQLSLDHLFATVAIMQHDSLSADALADVFDWDIVRARLIMQHLEHHLITLPEEERNVASDRTPFRVNPLLGRPLVSELQRRHIVYWPT